MAERLKGKVAVITGAASGIGGGTARRFAAEGAKVVVADMQVEAGEALATALGEALFVKTDVSSEDAVEAAIAAAVARFGRLDCLVNNAGFVGAVGPVAGTSTQAWRATLAVLLDGVFFGMKHAARVLIRQGQGGSILSTSSVAGLRGGFGAHGYTTAKHAVIGLTRSVASELAPHGIRVNAVCPGGVISALSTNLVGDEKEAIRMLAETSPMRAATFPEDIANAFVYLASDEARLITGQTLVVDAGVTMAPEVVMFHTMEPAFMGPASLLDRVQ